jgi:hypothetical protein
MVTVNIGGDSTTTKKTFSVQKCFLVNYSDYFRAPLGGSWKEAEDQAITFANVEPQIFEVYVDWLYTQKGYTDLSKRP